MCLVINKSDHQELDHVAGDFAGLGLGDGISVSAAHGRNIRLLLGAIDSRLTPFAESIHEAEEASRVTGLKIVVIGRPNAGKSSLVNAILDDDRTIVSEVAGTTRDAVDIPYDRAGERHTLIDTAGLRQRSRMDTSVRPRGPLGPLSLGGSFGVFGRTVALLAARLERLLGCPE